MSINRSDLILATAKRTFVAFCFGFILSLVFSTAAALKFEPIIKLERESADFGLRLTNAVFSQSFEPTLLPDRASPLYMIDVDAQACAALASETRCNYDRVMQPEVLAMLVEAIKVADPALVVLDGLIVPELADGLSGQIDALGIPVLTPMELSEFESAAGYEAGQGSGQGSGQKDEFGYLLDKSLCGRPQCGGLSYLPAQIFMEGGKTRYYPREMKVNLVSLIEEGKAKAASFETLAYRAAKLASPADKLHDNGPMPEIGYTIPSFSFQGGGQRIDQDRYDTIAGNFRGNVELLSLSKALSEEGASVDFEKPPPEAILIIGSTALSARDIHNTPLGPMGGMEVVANAIRSFQLSTPEAAVSPFEAFFIKLGAVLKALVVIALTEVLLAFLAQRRRAATAQGKQTVECGRFCDRWSLWIVLAMLFAFGAELAVAGWEILSQMNSTASSANTVDVIWPIAGVTASALIGFSSEILSKLEWIADRGIAASTRLLGRYAPAPAVSDEIDSDGADSGTGGGGT